MWTISKFNGNFVVQRFISAYIFYKALIGGFYVNLLTDRQTYKRRVKQNYHDTTKFSDE